MKCGTSQSGLRWCVDERPESLTATIGIWVRAGSRHDPRGAEGLAHLVEHGVFHTPSTGVLGPEHDLVDAWTGIDDVAYLATVEGEDAGLAAEELARLVFFPEWDDDAVDHESAILAAEMRSPVRSPIACVAASTLSSLYPGQPFARNIFRRAPLTWPLNSWMARSFHRSFYTPENAVLVATGAITAEQVAAAAAGVVGLHHGALRAPPALPNVRALPVAHNDSDQSSGSESAFVAVGVRAPARGDRRQTAAVLAAHMLGGGAASRLQRDLRGDRKLVYDVASFCLAYNEGGALISYAATTPDQIETVVGALHEHVDALRSGMFEDDELALALRRVRSAAASAEEGAVSRVRRLGVSMLHGGRPESASEVQERIERVRRQSIRATLAYADERTVVVCPAGAPTTSDLSSHRRSAGLKGVGLVAARG